MKERQSFVESLGVVYSVNDNNFGYAVGRMLQENQLGKPLITAMKDISEQLTNPDVTEFVEAILQTDQTDKKLLEVVRAQAELLRRKHPNP